MIETDLIFIPTGAKSNFQPTRPTEEPSVRAMYTWRKRSNKVTRVVCRTRGTKVIITLHLTHSLYCYCMSLCVSSPLFISYSNSIQAYKQQLAEASCGMVGWFQKVSNRRCFLLRQTHGSWLDNRTSFPFWIIPFIYSCIVFTLSDFFNRGGFITSSTPTICQLQDCQHLKKKNV